MGVSVHYADAEVCGGVILEMPEGSRQEVVLWNGIKAVVRELPRRVEP